MDVLSHGGYNIYGLEDQGAAAPRRKPYGGNPWCLGPQESPYGPGLILMQKVARQPL
jgi:hypothetical protein